MRWRAREDGAVTTTAAQRAHGHLRGRILSGSLPPGTMLSEGDLAASLQMSRTPVRTALTRLQDEGWVTIYPQRGALVRELTATEVREAAQLRRALETAGVRDAAPAQRAALAGRLTPCLAAQDEALDRGDVTAFTQQAMAFHRAFAELTANALVLAAYDRVADVQQLTIARSAVQILGDPGGVAAEHRRLLGLATAGDATGFAEHLAAHQAAHHGLQP